MKHFLSRRRAVTTMPSRPALRALLWAAVIAYLSERTAPACAPSLAVPSFSGVQHAACFPELCRPSEAAAPQAAAMDPEGQPGGGSMSRRRGHEAKMRGFCGGKRDGPGDGARTWRSRRLKLQSLALRGGGSGIAEEGEEDEIEDGSLGGGRGASAEGTRDDADGDIDVMEKMRREVDENADRIIREAREKAKQDAQARWEDDQDEEALDPGYWLFKNASDLGNGAKWGGTGRQVPSAEIEGDFEEMARLMREDGQDPQPPVTARDFDGLDVEEGGDGDGDGDGDGEDGGWGSSQDVVVDSDGLEWDAVIPMPEDMAGLSRKQGENGGGGGFAGEMPGEEQWREATKDVGPAGSLAEGCSGVVQEARRLGYEKLLRKDMDDMDQDDDRDQDRASRLIVFNISSECSSDMLMGLKSILAGFRSATIVDKGGLDPRATSFLLGPPKARHKESSMLVDVDNDAGHESDPDKDTVKWLERVGVKAPDSAVSLVAEAPTANASWLSSLAWPGAPYAIVEFESRSDADKALDAFAPNTHGNGGACGSDGGDDDGGAGVVVVGGGVGGSSGGGGGGRSRGRGGVCDGWGAKICGERAAVRRAWGDTSFLEHLLHRCQTRQEVVRLMSHHMSRGLVGLGGQECAMVLMRIDRLSKRNPRRDYAKRLRVSEMGMPRLDPFVQESFQPHNATLVAQQSLIAALLERVVKLSPLMSTSILAQVLKVVTHLHSRGIGLPAGLDHRKRSIPAAANKHGIYVITDSPVYGYPGLQWRVFRELSEMRNGTVLEAATGCSKHVIPPSVLESNTMSQGQRRRSRPCSINPHVPGGMYAGDHEVKGAYTARSGGGAALRRWVSGNVRTTVSDRVLRKRMRRRDKSIDTAEVKNFRRRVAENYHAQTEEAVNATIASLELMPYSEGIYYDLGSVRKPLCYLGDEGCSETKELDPAAEFSYETDDEVSDPIDADGAGCDDEEEGAIPKPVNYTKRTWRRIPEQQRQEVASHGSYKGWEDPAYGRWKRGDLPPSVEERMFPEGMPRTTEIRMREAARFKAKGRPFVDCVGGLKLPEPSVAQRLLKNADGHDGGGGDDDGDFAASSDSREQRVLMEVREKMAAATGVGYRLAKASNHTPSAQLKARTLPLMGALGEPGSRIFPDGWARAEEKTRNPLRLRGFGGAGSHSRIADHVVVNDLPGSLPFALCSPKSPLLGLEGGSARLLRLKGCGDVEEEEQEEEEEEEEEEEKGGSGRVMGDYEALARDIIAKQKEDEVDSIEEGGGREQPLDKYFMGQDEWDEKFVSIIRRLEDPNGPTTKGTEKERRALADDIADHMMGCTQDEFAVLRGLSDRAKQRAQEDGKEDYCDMNMFEALDQGLSDYSDLDRDVDEEGIKQLIINEKMMRAVEANDCHEVRRLINGGAQVNFMDFEYYGWCGLHHAAGAGNTEMFEALIDLGADVDGRDNSDCTPLYYAAREGKMDMVERLVQHGANVSAVDEENRQALHVCAGRGHTLIVRRLLELGCDVNHRNCLGDTPLAAAAAWGQTEAVKVLLEFGAEVNSLNNLLFKPIDLALDDGYQETIDVLVNAGAIVEEIDPSKHWDVFWQDYRRMQEANGVPKEQLFDPKVAREEAKRVFASYEKIKKGDTDIGQFLRDFDNDDKPLYDMPDQDQAEKFYKELQAHKSRVSERSAKRSRKAEVISLEQASSASPGLETDERYSML